MVQHLLAWLKRLRWWVWAAIAFGTALLLFLLKALFAPPGQLRSTDGSLLPQVPKALQERVAHTEEAALQQRVTAKVAAESDRAELERIAKENDGVERRRRLAEMLKRL